MSVLNSHCGVEYTIDMQRETIRQTIHIGLFILVFLLPVISRLSLVALLAGLLAATLVVVPRAAGLRRLLHRSSDKRYARGGIAYFSALIILVVLFPVHSIVAGWAALGLGDGTATLIGSRIGRAKLPWKKTSSWWGSIAFIFATFFGTAGALLVVAPDLAFNQIGLIAGLAAIGGAIIEMLPLKFNDNLTIPLVVGLLTAFVV
jgi:dolichol kinase